MVVYCDVTRALTGDQMEQSRCVTMHLHACTEQTGVEMRTRVGHPWLMERFVRRVCTRGGGGERGGIRKGGGGV